MRKRSGSILKRRGKYWARVIFADPMTGKRREAVRAARTKAEASDIRDRLIQEIDASDGWALVHEHKTFGDLVDYYIAEFAHEPVYVDGRKIAGMRTYDTAQGQLKVLRDYFGNARSLRSITYEDLRRFKVERLKAPPVWATKRLARLREERAEAVSHHQDGEVERIDGEIGMLSAKKRAIASVHRELALLHKMLVVAARQRWIMVNPFDHGQPLISPADEKQRQTILSPENESRLLAACDAEGRKHLKPIIIAALDTGMRQGEILKLKWADIDFVRAIITVRAFNTKTLQKREVAMTPRLMCELQKLKSAAKVDDPETLVFGVKDNVKRSFTTVRNAAGLPGLRFHDLRHTAATRLAAGSLSLPEIGRVLGHSQPRTTYRYVNPNEETLNRAKEILSKYGTAESVDSFVQAGQSEMPAAASVN